MDWLTFICGIVIALLGIAVLAMAYDFITDGPIVGLIIIGIIGLGCLAGGSYLAYEGAAGRDPFGPRDPCRYIVSTGKITIALHHKGWISEAGRPVWCGPGPVPLQQP